MGARRSRKHPALSGPELKPWYEHGRRSDELDALKDAGFKVLDERVDDYGRLILTSEVRYRGEPLRVDIQFAADHPFIPPTVVGERVVIDRHQRPNDRNFCLDREDAPWWTPQHTAADALKHLQALLAADEAGTLMADEADMPEPISGQLAYWPKDRVVLVPDPLLAETLTGNAGMLEVARSSRQPQLWVVTRYVDGRHLHELIGQNERSRLNLAGNLDRRRVDWRAVDLPAGRPGVERALEELVRTARPGAEKAAANPHRKVTKRETWAAITFMEEGPRRGERQRAWVFARTTVTFDPAPRRGVPLPVPSQALSRPVRQLRTRALRGLEHAHFLVIGAGSVGGFAALDLARAGAGALDIVDGDTYDINNGVRHVLPATYAGRNKAKAVAEFARACSPFTEARGRSFSVGGTESARSQLHALISEADVVVDATGSRNVTRLLHWHAAHAGIPLVSGALTPGGLAARIVVLRKPSPCLDCFESDPTIPSRDADRAANTTPYGCSHPAASCAPFEVTELAANLARSATSCIPRLGYPALDFDWAVINFRRAVNRWTQGLLVPHAGCPVCAPS